MGGAFVLEGLFSWGLLSGGFCPVRLLSVARRKRGRERKREQRIEG